MTRFRAVLGAPSLILAGLWHKASFCAPGLFADTIILRIHARFFPLLEDLPQTGIGLGILAFVIGVLDPFFEKSAVTAELLLKGGIKCEVVDFVGVFAEVVEFLGGTGAEEDFVGELGEGSLRMALAQSLGVILFITILRLEEGAVGEKIADVAEVFGAHRANAVDGVIAAIPRRDDMGARRKVFPEEVLPIEVVGDGEAGESEGGGGDIEGGDQVLADSGRGESFMGTGDDQGRVSAGLGAELLGAEGVIVAMIGEPENEGVLKESVGLQVGEDDFGVLIGLANSVEVMWDR